MSKLWLARNPRLLLFRAVESLKYHWKIISWNFEKVQKRSQRLTSERRLTKLKHDTKNSETHCWHKWRLHEKHFGESRGPTSLNRKNDPQSLLTETEKLNAVLSCEKSANYDLRKKAHRLDLQCSRAQASLRKYRSSLRSKTTGSAVKGRT